MNNKLTYDEFASSNRERASQDTRRHFHYDLQVYDDDFRFTLAVSPGVIIEDDFEGIYMRWPLYQQMEGGEIFKWLCEVHRRIVEGLD